MVESTQAPSDKNPDSQAGRAFIRIMHYGVGRIARAGELLTRGAFSLTAGLTVGDSVDQKGSCPCFVELLGNKKVTINDLLRLNLRFFRLRHALC